MYRSAPFGLSERENLVQPKLYEVVVTHKNLISILEQYNHKPF